MPESTPSFQIEPQQRHTEKEDAPEDIIQRANNWADERFSFNKAWEGFWQWKARKSIAHDIAKDLHDRNKNTLVNQREIEKRKKRFHKLIETTGHNGPLVTDVQDLYTGKTYYTVMYEGENGELIAEERRNPYKPNEKSNDPNDIVTQVIINPDGSTKYILNFIEEPYIAEGRNANPDIQGDTFYTRAAIRTFDLLHGVIKKGISPV